MSYTNIQITGIAHTFFNPQDFTWHLKLSGTHDSKHVKTQRVREQKLLQNYNWKQKE